MSESNQPNFPARGIPHFMAAFFRAPVLPASCGPSVAPPFPLSLSLLSSFLGVLLAALALLAFPGTSWAAEKGGSVPFSKWLADFRVEAAREGISRKTIDSALEGLSADPKVLELDRRQPEKRIRFSRYKENVITKGRIREGRAMMKKHAALLSRIEARYGVSPSYIVALWGMETSFGKNTGGFNIIRSLATLAWEGRRGAFFRQELLDALKILDSGHISAQQMRGSWAGAMGQNQFMPSSFHKFAVDFNRDGRRDIWMTQGDVFASTANYLKSSGWRPGWRWGRSVVLPKGCCTKEIKDRTRQTLAQWKARGLRFAGGGEIPEDTKNTAWLAAPDGGKGPVWLVYGNYDVLMRWNRSTYFATSVGLLADAIAQEASP